MTNNVDTSPLLKERGGKYGHPSVNLRNTADLWRESVQGRSVHLSKEQAVGIDIALNLLDDVRVLGKNLNQRTTDILRQRAESALKRLQKDFGVRIGEHDPAPSVKWVCRQMICLKLSRTVCGDENHKDSWSDIVGYAKIAEDFCDDNE